MIIKSGFVDPFKPWLMIKYIYDYWCETMVIGKLF